MPGEKQQTGVSRRTLVKSAALGSLALAAGGVSLPFGMRTAAAAVQQAMRNEEDKIVWGRLFGQLRQSLRSASACKR